LEVFLISDVVSWAAEFPIKTGQLDSFKALVEEMVKPTRNEPNTLAYEWFFN
jgi:quinol monooxygenase YgiN